ncbi:MAG: MinD/ParA family protein, partial [Gammaproteobacteria bacterium]
GKSTLSINLAVASAAAGRRAVLLDGDLGLANADVLLGITPRHTLGDLITGHRGLDEVLTPARPGLSIVAGASGIGPLAELDEAGHVGIIRAFSDLTADLDLLLVDTAAGISPGVLQLTQAAQHVVVVVCDEPASVTDAYAVIKILSRHHGLRQFRVVSNMTQEPQQGARLFDALRRVTERFLDVTLEHCADIPADELLRRAVREQRPVVEAFPGSPAAQALRRLAGSMAIWAAPEGRGNIGFFAERIARPVPRLQVVR